MTMSPGQKKLLTYGVPIVAVLGLIAFLRSRNSAPATSGTTGASTTSAVDAGQLAGFENSVQAQLAAFAGQLSSAGSIPVSTPTSTSSSTSTGSTTVSSVSSPSAPAPSSSPAPSTSAPLQTSQLVQDQTAAGLLSSAGYSTVPYGGGGQAIAYAPGSTGAQPYNPDLPNSNPLYQVGAYAFQAKYGYLPDASTPASMFAGLSIG